MEKINILRISTHPTTEYNTIGLHCYWLNSFKNFNTIHVTPVYPGEIIEPKGSVKIIRIPMIIKPKPKNTSWLKRTYFSLARAGSVIIFNLRAIKQLSRKNRIKIVHIHSPMYMLVAFMGRILKKKVYITYHGEDFYKVYKSKIYKLFSPIFDCIFSLSPAIIKSLKKIQSKPVIQVYNGVDIETFKYLKKKRKKQIIMVSSFKYQKGHKYLINAFKKFVDKNKEYRLILVGDGIYKKEIMKMCVDKEIEEKVIFSNYIDTKPLVELYNKSEIFILPSLWEGFPKVLLEAMACGCKIITSNVDAISLVFGENYKYYIDPKNPNDIFKKLNLIINDKHYSVEEIIKKAKMFNWESIYKNYLENYDFN